MRHNTGEGEKFRAAMATIRGCNLLSTQLDISISLG
jgi:hypothetical protein